MNILNWKKERWQLLLNIQITIGIITYLCLAITDKTVQPIFIVGILLVLLVLNKFQDKNKITKNLTIWLNIIVLTDLLCSVWRLIGNTFLKIIPQLSVLIILIAWAIWLVLLLPLVMVSVSQLQNWILRLIALNMFLQLQYGMDTTLKISRHLPIMHSLNNQGVISAFAVLLIVCFSVYSWGYRFNPNLKFRRSSNFSWGVFITLCILLALGVIWNDFGNGGNNLFSILFTYSVSIQSKYMTFASFTSALEPGILEEAIRYVDIMILLIAFQNLRKWRVPIAIYGSTLLFALPHFSNIGWQGQTVMATVAQVLAVTDAMVWAAAYLYFGKIWPIMIVHFLNDYLINLQSGWDSISTWSGSFADWATSIIPIIFGLAVTIWMMFGKRRQVMEENVDRLLLRNNQEFNLPTFISQL